MHLKRETVHEGVWISVKAAHLHQVSASDVPMSANDMSADDVTGDVLAS